MPQNKRLLVSTYTPNLSAEDFEERTLLERYVALIAKLEPPIPRPGVKVAHPAKKDVELWQAELQAILLKLGYDPQVGRPPRPRGKPRDSAIPEPLPAVGTELQSCLGDTYRVEGYASRPWGDDGSVILYTDHQGRFVARSVIQLFCGTMGSGEPFVTWPSDPRGLQPQKPIPMLKRRTMTRQDLRNDEHADPDRGKHVQRPKGAY